MPSGCMSFPSWKNDSGKVKFHRKDDFLKTGQVVRKPVAPFLQDSPCQIGIFSTACYLTGLISSSLLQYNWLQLPSVGVRRDIHNQESWKIALMTRKMTDEDINVLMRRFYWVIGVVVVLCLIPLFIYAFYLEKRIDNFQSTLKHSPPQELPADESGRGNLQHLETNPVEGQMVYVPAYSHVYQSEGKPLLLTITLSVRNTSREKEIVVKSVRYFDTKGREVNSYLDKPVRLPALGTTEVLIKRNDATGGSGANFLVEWYADQPVTEPIIEAVMVDTTTQQGVSFVCRGSVISEVIPESSLETGRQAEPSDSAKAQ